MNLQKILYGICFAGLMTILPVSLTSQAATSTNSVEIAQQDSNPALYADRDDSDDRDDDNDRDGDDDRDDDKDRDSDDHRDHNRNHNG